MTIRIRLAVFVATILAIVFSLLIYAGYSENRNNQKLSQILSNANSLTLSIEILDGHFQKQLLSWSNLLLRGEEPDNYYRYLQNFYKQERETRSEISSLDKKLAKYPEAKIEMIKLYKQHNQLGLTYRKALKVYNQSDNPIYETDKEISNIADEPLKTLDSVKASVLKHKLEKIEDANTKSKEQRNFIFIIAAVSLILIVFSFLWVIDVNLGRPLAIMLQAASDIYRGNLEQRVTEELPGEFKVFGRAFNQMTNKLVKSNNELNKHMDTLKSEIERREKLEKELKSKRYAAEDASQAKTEFISTISHEIRTPLNVVIGYSDLLSMSELNDKQKKYINSIRAGGESLLNIINDVLDLAKIEAGKLEIENKVFNLNSLIEEVSLMFQKQISDKGLSFELIIDKQLPVYIVLDEHRLKQILMNLISNAIKFTDQGSIVIRVCVLNILQDTIDLRFEIQDSGLGISEEFHQKIFDLFSQQDGQDTRRYGGTGLGLSICQKLSTMLNGEIKLNSVLNEGSLFSLNLYNVETVKQFESIVRKQAIDVSEQILFETKILIVDDISANRKLLCEFLNEDLIEIIEAANGIEAIEMAHKHKPDLILMDIKMPEMDGVEATKRIKADARLKDIPIIAVTASSIKGSDVEQRKALFDDYLTKPVQLKVLLDAVKKFIG